MSIHALTVLLLFVASIYGCFIQPVAQSVVQSCVSIGTAGQLVCDVSSLVVGNIPLATGACSELGFDFNQTSGYLPDTTYRLRIQQYEVSLIASLDQGRWGRNTTKMKGWARCDCQGDVSPVCYQYKEHGFVGECTTIDLCADHTGPCAPLCATHLDEHPCFGRSWWCGVSGSELQPEVYWLAAVGGTHLYATLGLDIIIGGKTFVGQPTTYLLDNTQFIRLENTVVDFAVNITLNPFNIPELGLAGLGAWVTKYHQPQEAWMLSGVILQTEKVPCDTPFWMFSLDLNDWFYWVEDYASRIVWSFLDCSTNSADDVQSIAYQVLAESMRVIYKLSSEYVYWNSTQGPSAYAKFNLTGIISLQATFQTKATGVLFIESYATVHLLSAGSTFTCLDGEAGVWMVYNNTGDAGLFSITVIDGNGTSYQVGSKYTNPGVYNSSSPFPYADLTEHTLCAKSTVTSCVKFRPKCVAPYNPYPPPSPGTGDSSSSGSGLAWYWWLLIILGVIALILFTLRCLWGCFASPFFRI